METKIKKLKELRKESNSKNEIFLVNVYDSLLNKMNDNTNNEEFDKIVISFMKDKLEIASKFYRKKMLEESGRESYSVLLLSSLFFNNRYKAKINIDKKRVELIEDEY